MEPSKNSFSLDVKLQADQAERTFSLKASDVELSEITNRLKVEAARAVAGHGTIRFVTKRKELSDVIVDGHVEAVLTRLCVVTLEPMDEPIAADFHVRLTHEMTEDDIQSDDDIDILNGDTLDIADLLLQQISLAMTAYPKSEAALSADNTFGDQSDADDNASPSGAFAQLKGLLDEQD